MWLNGVEEEWPLQRLVHMLSETQKKEKDSWKETILSPHASMKDIGPDERDSMVIWFAKLTTQFHFHPETFFLSTNILDRFITSVKAQPKYLKCIAISCFYLACKITEEEDIVPCTGELVKDSECNCQVKDVLRMERIILEKLSWDINSSTPLDYLHIFQVLSFAHYTDLCVSLSLPHHMGMLTNQLIRLMTCYQLARFPSAALALALVSIELESITKDPAKWTNVTGQLQSLAKRSLKRLLPVFCTTVMGGLCCLYVSCLETRGKFLSSLSVILHQHSLQGDVHLDERLLAVTAYPALKVETGDLMTCRQALSMKLRMHDSGRPFKKAVFLKHVSLTAHATQDSVAKVLSQSCGAIKRKAAAASPDKVNEWSKKPHPDLTIESDAVEDGMELGDEAYDSDKTLTASEGEEDDPELKFFPVRPPTYAEIVKCGLDASEAMDHQETTGSSPTSPNDFAPNMSRRCSLQAKYGFAFPSLSNSHNPQRGIRT